MKVSVLHAFLNGTVNATQFKSEIEQDVENYKIQLQKKGSSIILKIQDDMQFIFNKKHLLRLCNYYLDAVLTCWELEYIVDCIILRKSPEYENEELLDHLETITDSAINGEISNERINRIKNSLLA